MFRRYDRVLPTERGSYFSLSRQKESAVCSCFLAVYWYSIVFYLSFGLLLVDIVVFTKSYNNFVSTRATIEALRCTTFFFFFFYPPADGAK